MTKEELVKKARSLGIPANKTRKESTLIKKIQEKEKQEQQIPQANSLETAMTLLLQSQAETTKLLGTIVDKLDNLGTDNEKQDTQIEKKKRKIVYKNEWLIQRVDKNYTSIDGKKEYQVLGTKQFKTYEEALTFINEHGGLDNYRIVPIPIPIGVDE